ncbi:putative MFS family arabinose efflux permease [Subtercola boreus]|uniref:MFS transporter n=1 Tax=Subtercola boreus TaxID=120213 RepID=UPI0011752F8D|nr:MFS transporter [Subtercola boreus]TQL55950.1 putative MFS family arabinose efflux permease [Subtercola boreus]
MNESPNGTVGVAEPDPQAVQLASPREVRRVLVSSFVGALIEWYDFYVFGIASAIVFGRIFFPAVDPAVGTLAAFATLAVGFFARPIGGAIWGHFGDRIGRKRMLVLSIIVMGIGTTIIGMLPTYAQIGVAAPVILVILRFLQGIAAGGEWGGAVLIAMEHSPKRRGLSSSFPQMGLTGGILLATGVFALVALLPEDQLLSWGWRLPFLFSAILIVVGLWIRLGIHESPIFLAAQKAAAGATGTVKQQAPIIQVFRHPKALIIAICLVVGPFAISSVYSTFAASYGLLVGFNASQMSTVVLFTAAIGFVCQPIFGALSDYWGRKLVVTIGLVVQAVSAFFMFEQLNAHSLPGVYLTMGIIGVGHAICYAPMAAWLGELFPTHLRYTGASLGYQIAGSVGGLTPLICSALLIAGGGAPNTLYVVLFSVLVNVIALVAVLFARETSKDVLV